MKNHRSAKQKSRKSMRDAAIVSLYIRARVAFVSGKIFSPAYFKFNLSARAGDTCTRAGLLRRLTLQVSVCKYSYTFIYRCGTRRMQIIHFACKHLNI